MRFLERIATQVRDRPDAPAVREPGGAVLTYRELDALAGEVAADFGRRGLRAGDRVCLVLPRSARLVATQLAALRTGIVFTSLDPAQPPDRVHALCEAVRPRLLVTAEQVRELPGGAPAPGAYCLFTSGSTGTPAAVLVGREALHTYVEAFQDGSACAPADRAAVLGSPGFDVTVEEIWPFLAAGAQLVLAPEEVRSAPARLVSWLAAEQVTTAFVPPLLLGHVCAAGDRLPALRLVRTGGERVTGHPPTGLPFAVRNEYGPTEATVAVTWWELAPGGTGAPPIGRPLPHAVLRVCDAHGTEAAEGELWISGPSLAEGYLGDPELTAARFTTTPDGTRWYRSGDRVRVRPDGALDYLGRIDRQVQLLGKRVEPAEVEAVLERHPAVARAAVLVRTDAQGRAQGLLGVVLPHGPLDLAGLRAHTAAALPAHMVPDELRVVAELPVSPSGKVDHAALAVEEAPEPVADPLSEAVAIWAEVLLRDDVTEHSDLFELGGTSLHAMEIVARLHERLGVSASVRDVFDHPSPSGVVAALAGGGRR
ncbi:non-ribosomal peptide synthetase component F/acyl carrier protein [Crossiella equi]|uniref:Non-ribosomal peptide synthetase component F/acyl carrier protein n=1 Tax=Crossiella equi TaxID=130796 RepID=A0ABS5A4F1_9PSEU|nr:non-ribosomal peptide synthetase [Crossiella equi]MBP2471449.1 non-ribosomal peptide synthetase component F/acyl carrier protein [Crossiella equi]